MRDYQRKALWEKREFPPCDRSEPYVYLNFSPFDLKEGLAALSILNGLGCRVWYDEKMLSGRPWTSGICDAIESCSAFFEVYALKYRFSLTKELAHEFANRLEIPRISVFLHDKMPEEESKYPKLIYTTPDDPSYPERCRLGLEAAGYFSAEPQDPSADKYDLMMDYYRTFKDYENAFGGRLPQSLNLRTHESHGYLGHYERSDEDVYAAVRYGVHTRYFLRRRSSMEDYRPKRKDILFTESILELNGDATAELEREFEKRSDVPKPGRPFPSGYPYKDEFEYLSSDED